MAAVIVVLIIVIVVVAVACCCCGAQGRVVGGRDPKLYLRCGHKV